MSGCWKALEKGRDKRMLCRKNIILTGANRGIGNAILVKLVQNHANVWCLVRTRNEHFVGQTLELMETYHVWIKIVPINLESEESIQEAVREVMANKENIDALVNCAGAYFQNTFLMTTETMLKRLYEVNYFANIQLIQAVARKMIPQRSGNIINITSASGFEHNVGTFAYGATKAAMNWATQTISRELAPYNIRVNAVSPGITLTELNCGNEEVIEKNVIPRMNIKREGRPEEIADGVLFLLSDAASFISGQIIRIDGGRF